jgi:hypothetical protein
MPGVVVTTAVRSGPSTATTNPSSTYFVAGTAPRGPVGQPTLVNSIADFEVYYGGYNADTNLHQHLQTFFEEGGSRAYVSRVVGASATAGTAQLGGLIFTAANPGEWSSNMSVVIVTAGGNAFKLRIFLDGDIVYTSPLVTKEGQVAAAMSTSPIASAYVTVSGSTPDEDLTVGDDDFSTGNNGGTVTEAITLAGLAVFESALGSGAVAAPGLYSDTAYDGLIAHAVANNRIALLAVNPANTTADDVIAATKNYISGVVSGEYAALYYPHVTIVDGSGTVQAISPESYVAAKRAKAHNEVGAWKIGAGLQSKANFVTGTTQAIDKVAGAALDEAQINAIRVIQNSVRVYGARSLSVDEMNFRFINARDMLNFVVAESEKRLEDLLFAPVDGRRAVLSQVESSLIALLDPLRTAGGLFESFDADGSRIDSGYSVEVSDAMNPLAQLADGVVRAKVGVRISSISDKIEIEIVKSNLTSSVV